ncbi:MAG TPA: ankyrin repeat domain-containing protein [Chthonomonadaceae bacterium]|nr:ankyrin repeat domain-containing protein [Chthonomonadaceae bacterium]
MAGEPTRRSGRGRLIILLSILALLLAIYLPIRRHRLDTGLVAAVIDGDAEAVHSLLNSGADPNARFVSAASSPTPTRSLWEWLRSLFERSKPPWPNNDKTMLMLAASKDDAAIVKDLLAHGADVNIKLSNGNTVLLLAAPRADADIINALLDHGADLRVRNRDGLTPLLLAAEQGNTGAVRALLDHGANINETGKNNETPLLLAARGKRAEPPRPKGAAQPIILSGSNMVRENNPSTHDATVRLLLQRGADIRDLERTGVSPLIWAAQCGSAVLIQALWQQHIDRHTGDYVGMQALDAAIRSQRAQAVKALLDHGVPVNRVQPWTPPPLITAAEGGRPEIVQLLLERGADVNCHDRQGNTPLLAAAMSYHQEIIRLLIRKGADVNARDIRGMTPLMYAVNASPRTVALLLEAGADVNAQDASGQTALMKAYQPETARLLLDHGANVNARDKQGQTPLINAARMASQNLVQLLIHRGADVNAVDNTGLTPLVAAMTTRYKPLIALLKKAGAKLSPTNSHGTKPMPVLSSMGSR